MSAFSSHEPIGDTVASTLIWVLLALFLTLIASTYFTASSITSASSLEPAVIDIDSYQIEIG
ncbi:MAG: hypothetical protein AB7G06_08590 [Bdellovibrionales bacterium]